MSKLHCCIDLELEQPKSNPQTPDSQLDEEKIIQVGYVIYSLEPDLHIHQEALYHVNINVPLSKFIKTLTGISDEDIKDGMSIEEIYDDLTNDLQIFNFSRIVKQWGGGDMDCLRKELPEVKWEFGHSGCNIKHMYQMYAEANGLNTSGGLKKSLNRIGLGWEGRKAHNALADAFNTARMHKFLYDKIKGE